MDRAVAIRQLIAAAIPGAMTAIELSASLSPADRALARSRVERDLRHAVGRELADRLSLQQLFELREGRGAIDVDQVVAKAVAAALERVPAPDGLLDRRQAACRLGVSMRTLARLAIPTVRIGRRLGYQPADLDRFLADSASPRPAARRAKPPERRAKAGGGLGKIDALLAQARRRR